MKDVITSINSVVGLVLPGVEDFHSRFIEIAPVARNDRESVVKGGRGKHKIRVFFETAMSKGK